MMLTPPVAQPQRLQDLESDLHLLDRVGRERDAERVADAHPEELAEADRRLDRAGGPAARLGDAEMDRRVRRVGELLVGGRRKEHVGRLGADLELVEVIVLQDADVLEARLDHRFRAGLSVFLKQVPLEAAGVHADADRAAVVLRRLDDVTDAILRADIAGVDAEAGGPGLGRLDGALVVEVDVGNDRDISVADDLLQGDPRSPGREPTRGRCRAPAAAQQFTCSIVAFASVVSVFVIVCTLIGASPPTATRPTWIWRLLRRSMLRQGRMWFMACLFRVRRAGLAGGAHAADPRFAPDLGVRASPVERAPVPPPVARYRAASASARCWTSGPGAGARFSEGACGTVSRMCSASSETSRAIWPR